MTILRELSPVITEEGSFDMRLFMYGVCAVMSSSLYVYAGEQQIAPALSAHDLFYACNYALAHKACTQEIAQAYDEKLLHRLHIMRGQCDLSMGVDAYFAGDAPKAAAHFKGYWADFEHKLMQENVHNVPLWQVGDAVTNKTVCVIAGMGSDGFGDTAAFLKWIQPIKQSGATKVLLYLDGHSLLNSVLSEPQTLETLGIDAIHTRKKGPLPIADVYVPLMNLPARVNKDGLGMTTPDTVPLYDAPYIFPNTDAVAVWHAFIQKQVSSDPDIIPLAFNHSASTKATAGGVCAIDRTIECTSLVQAMTHNNKAFLLFVGGRDHYPVRESIYQKLKSNGQLGSLEERDIVPDSFEILTAQHADPTNLASEIICKRDEKSGAPSDKKIIIVKDAQPFVDVQAVHHCCDKLAGLTITADTATENFAGAGNYKTYLIMKKGPCRARRWGSWPAQTWLFNAVTLIGEDDNGMSHVFDRVQQVIKESIAKSRSEA